MPTCRHTFTASTRLFARRIHHADVAEEHQVASRPLLVGIVLRPTACTRRRARAARPSPSTRSPPGAGPAARRRAAVPPPLCERRAPLQHDLGRAFHEREHAAVGHGVNRGHPLALGAERELLHPGRRPRLLRAARRPWSPARRARPQWDRPSRTSACAVLADHRVARKHPAVSSSCSSGSSPGPSMRPSEA